ncbi:hypothetical protein BKA83DRAFT_10252 [Pisolithus microcarpus]|nr:hypothetical protein BKA83DRAFT_10252 [Pisolithus microcarpus]
MFRRYQLRSTSAQGPRPSNSRRTASSSSASSRPTTPQFGGPLASSYQPDGPAVPTGITLTVPRSLWQRATSVGVLDEPISAGVRRERDDDDDLSQLDSHRVKHLKLYAKKIAEVNQILEKGLMEFVNTGDLFYMLVDIKAHLIKSDATKQTNQFQVLQDTLRGKDFEAGLHTRLLACMLSPNLTAYVTDTQQRIMEFIAEHPEVFKVPGGIFDDAELKTLLGKLVTKLLASIRSHVKTQLITSIAKRTCIIDATRNLAHSTSGMELEASHWNRMAFLRRCLRIFLIGTGDHRVVSMDVCFTHSLIPMLKPDMRKKIQQELNIDIEQIEQQMQEGDEVDINTYLDDPPAINTEGSTSVLDPCDSTGTDEDDADGILDSEDPTDGVDDLDDDDSGFRLDGKRTRFNGQKFWNYVDYMLNLLRDMAHKSTTSNEDYEKEVGRIMVQIFQDDLADCPGSRKGSRLATVIHPPWQSTIQHGLVW